MIPRLAASLAFLALCAAPAAAQPPTMAQLWPSDDGRSWRYNQHYDGSPYDPDIVDNQVRVFFDGTTTAAGGVATQYLRQDLVSGPAPAQPLAGAAATFLHPDPFMRAVWMARPDLRARIEQIAAELPCPDTHPDGGYAILLGGEFAWLRGPSDVSAWRCNLANTRAWTWLTSNLSIGSTFTLQLIPDLASNVLLHGTVAAIVDANVPAGIFQDCVQVDYVIDYGQSECTDEGGNPIGSYRSETRGYVRYAPNVGPVESAEQFIPSVEGVSCGPWAVGEPVSLTTMELSALPVPARPMSWGKLKVAYR